MTNTSSRIAVGGLSIFLLIAAIAAGTAYAGSVVKKNDLIDEQTAEEFAILDAGVESAEISEIHTKLEFDHGQYEYDIKFRIGNSEYDYEIRAKDGSVLSKEIDKNDSEQSNDLAQTADRIDQQPMADPEPPEDALDQVDARTPAEPQTENPAPKAQPNNYISIDQAKKTALDHAGLNEDQVRFSSAKLENDDGIYEYEIEFYKDQMEYEYEIDAVTGEITKSEIDFD